MRVGVAAAQLGGDLLLVARVAEGEQEADGDRLGVDGRQGPEVERRDDALRPHPLVDADAAVEGDERVGVVHLRAVQARPGLAAELQQVLEAGGRHERGARAAALEQRVRGHRRAVREALELAGPDRLRGGDDGLLLRLGRRHLRDREAVALDEHRVGEGAADVDAEPAQV